MNEIFKKAMRSAFYMMSLCVVAWVFFPSLKTIAAGIVLGCAASLFNGMLLLRRVEFIGQAVAGTGVRKMGLGLAGRLSTVLLVVMIAHKFPGHLDVAATLSSAFYVQIAAFLITAVTYSKRYRGKG
ncbi:ATP synthase subunit I [Paenibacillus sp. sptzw28]|uniref:ATP synthase subunit I n=1 Tax=Paenibacillus sp. sptzw28 TaxID=715179 RepID=UPI001C6EC5D8|nr:ATP synthase subunit I [Paenibacillus sp. sptzw28]QYR22051.1 ATP synthase subunit I [Paenibacillus sp. sptzw28]